MSEIKLIYYYFNIKHILKTIKFFICSFNYNNNKMYL